MYGRNGESPLPGAGLQQSRRLLLCRRRSLAHCGAVHDGRSSCCRTVTWPMAPNRGAFPRCPSCPRSRGPPWSAGARREIPALCAGRAIGAAVGDPRHAGLMHRIGGLEKQHLTGAVSYDNENHHFMVQLRAQKIAKYRPGCPAAGSRRSVIRRVAGGQLGRDVWGVPHRLPTLPGRRAVGGSCAPQVPESVPGELG